MLPNPNLSDQPISRIEFVTLLSDNGFVHKKTLSLTEVWENKEKEIIINLPLGKSFIPTDFAEMTLNKIGIDSIQIDLYRGMLYGFNS